MARVYIFEYRPEPPYAFTPHLESFSIPGEPMPWVYDPSTRSFRRAFSIGGSELTPVHVSFTGEPWSPVIRVRAWSSGGSAARSVFELILKSVRAYFSYRSFLESIEEWPKLHSLATRYIGLRPGRSLTLYEALVDSVVKQRVALRVALRIQSKLVRRYGSCMAVGGSSTTLGLSLRCCRKLTSMRYAG